MIPDTQKGFHINRACSKDLIVERSQTQIEVFMLIERVLIMNSPGTGGNSITWTPPREFQPAH